MRCASIAALIVGAAAAPAFAAFVVPDGINYPWTRGVTANSASAQWDAFASVAGPNTPTASFVGGVLPGGAPAWNVANIGGGGMIFAGTTIYSLGTAMDVHVTAPNFDLGGGYTTTVLLQVRTQGHEITPGSVNLGGVLPTETIELSRGPSVSGFPLFKVETLYRFELAGNAASYDMQFLTAAGTHVLLDRVSVDTFARVPAPGACALLGLGGVMIGRRRRPR